MPATLLGATGTRGQTQVVAQVGWLATGTAGGPEERAFLEGMAKHGWVEWRNLVLKRGYVGDAVEDLTPAAASLASGNVKVIVAQGTDAVQAAKRAATNLPIVMAGASEPRERGFIESAATPGGLITGLGSDASWTTARRVVILREWIPALSHLGVIWYGRESPSVRQALADVRRAALDLAIQVTDKEIAQADSIDTAIASLKATGVDAAILLAHDSLTMHRRRIVAACSAARLVVLYPAREWCEAGGPLCYDADYIDLARRAADYVDRILRGARPASLPVEQPTRFWLVMNARASRLSGLRYSTELVLSADAVID